MVAHIQSCSPYPARHSMVRGSGAAPARGDIARRTYAEDTASNCRRLWTGAPCCRAGSILGHTTPDAALIYQRAAKPRVDDGIPADRHGWPDGCGRSIQAFEFTTLHGHAHSPTNSPSSHSPRLTQKRPREDWPTQAGRYPRKWTAGRLLIIERRTPTLAKRGTEPGPRPAINSPSSYNASGSSALESTRLGHA